MKRRNLSCLFCMFAALGLSACDDDSVSHDNNQSTFCGNGQLEEAESCDDGNTNSDDGCDADCVVEAGWECSNPGESCTKKEENNRSVCGDGKRADDEACDDGNKESGDGCSSGCVVEDGWTCSEAGKPCEKKLDEDKDVCGDGVITGEEACDDGNTADDDGCSSACAVEDGWKCEEAGQPCTKDDDPQDAVCGNGIIGGEEQCDDGNIADEDGCSSACAIEDGWKCEEAGQPCTKDDAPQDAECGDGIISGEEQCDDGNTEDEDGCSSSCTVEDGWKCEEAGQPCTKDDAPQDVVCGDGIIGGEEQCDDGNTADEDGCSSVCAVEDGWKCEEAGKPCTKLEEPQKPVCGDGSISGEEQCDDGNASDGDGCSAKCVIEDGWACTTAGKACTAVCGDGKILGTEKCDDGNAKDGDGCSAKCAIETGWACTTAGKACTAICGDGKIVGKEACDDGNTKNDDGCSAKCVVEESYICSEAGKACKPEFDNKKSIKILGIGNSFMRDSTIYLHDILKNMGYTDVTVGVLYTGGKSINWHAQNIRTGGKPATYFLDKNGKYYTYNEKNDNKLRNYIEAIKSEKWDYFIMQTYPSGVIDLYNKDIDYVIDTVNKYSPQKPKFGWSMTWALQLGKPHFQMYYHGHNPQKMYEATIMSVQTKIKPRSDISFVIPIATAIQNLRQGIFADNMNRDGYHMSLNNGRFAANLMWAKQITKRPVSKVTYKPKDYSYTDRQVAAIKEAVVNAYKKPYDVTRPSKGVNGTYLKANADLQKVFTDAGHKLEDFVEVPVGVTTKARYDATQKDADVCKLTAVHIDTNASPNVTYCTSSMISAETGSKAKDLNKYAASRIFTHYEIPTGSFIVIKSGYEYRPEGWGSDLTKATAAKNRPAIVKTQITEVTDKWWGSFEYRAFTISKAGAPALKDDELDALGSVMSIFVPIHKETTDEAMRKAGYDLSKYKKLSLSMAYRAYWNSDYKSDLPVQSGSTEAPKMPGSASNFPSKLFDGNGTAAHYAATRIFKKSEIPNGSIIVAMKGYAYIPDAWTALDKSNKDAGNRPVKVSAKDKNSIVVVDDKWWGNFKYRGFDITQTDVAKDTKLTALQETMLGEKFAIYVPK